MRAQYEQSEVEETIWMSLDAGELQTFMDRQNLFDLVRLERWARDQQRFDIMADCFHQKAWVRTSWYNGIGGQAYVDSTAAGLSRRADQANGQLRTSKHWVFPAIAQINGDRATVESPAKIFGRRPFGGIDASLHTYCRFHSRAVRQDGQWKLLTFHVLWEWDEMRSAIAGGHAPEIDYDLLNSMRPSYRFLAYAQALQGRSVNQNLLGDDRWDELMEFHRGEDAWLAGAGAIDDTGFVG